MLRFFQKHRILIILGVFAIALALTTYFILTRITEKGDFTPVKKGTIVEAIYGIGTVKASRTFNLKVGVAAIVSNIFVDEGQFVKKGKALIDLDTPRRYSAPFDGVVTALEFKVGETVFPQAPILTITDFENRYLIVSMEQQGAMRAQVGQTAYLSFESIRDQKYQGTVTSVYSNPTGFLVRIDVPNLPSTLLPEMTADVAITVKTHDNVLLVPANAIELGNIYLKKSDFEPLEEIPVTVGIVDGNMAQIISDKIKEGDQIRLTREK